MYKFELYRQLGLADISQSGGLKMNPENRRCKKVETIPLDAIKEKYARLFPGKTVRPAKPLRTTRGSLLIQETVSVKSNPTSRWAPLLSAISFPLPGGFEAFTRWKRVPLGTH